LHCSRSDCTCPFLSEECQTIHPRVQIFAPFAVTATTGSSVVTRCPGLRLGPEGIAAVYLATATPAVDLKASWNCKHWQGYLRCHKFYCLSL